MEPLTYICRGSRGDHGEIEYGSGQASAYPGPPCMRSISKFTPSHQQMGNRLRPGEGFDPKPR